MDLALFLSALMLGLAGVPHCVAMCGPSCAAVVGGARPGSARSLAFHGGRLLGYALAGAVAASSVGALAALAQWSPALRPLWTLAHAAALFLGLWLAWYGRQPAWVEHIGRRVRPAPAGGEGWQRVNGPLKSGAIGSAWVAWPCGLLQSALVVAALANTATGGAAVMAGFAAITATGLGVGPWLLARLAQARGGAVVSGAAVASWAVRAAGVMLAAASAWALLGDFGPAFLAYCFG